MLLRVIDVGTEEARRLCGITRGTYNTWLHNDTFVELYRKRADLAVEYKQEALRLLRRDNQLEAVLLEETIISKMKEEIKSGEYDLIRTNLAREVYSKLINDLDYQPQVANLTWEQRIQNILMTKDSPQITEGETVDGTVISETDNKQTKELTEGNTVQEGEQGSSQAQEENQT